MHKCWTHLFVILSLILSLYFEASYAQANIAVYSDTKHANHLVMQPNSSLSITSERII
jgi:hypothetical protein